MGRDTVQLETAVSTISQEYLLEFTSEYGISEDLHPELPGPEERIVDFSEGKVGVYTKFFEFANFRLPLSQFLFDILGHYQIYLSQLSVIGAAKVSHFDINYRVLNIVPTLNLFRVFYIPSFDLGWMSFSKRPEKNTPQCYTKPLDSLKNWNNRFFWVDERTFRTVADWCTSAPKDEMPARATYSAEATMYIPHSFMTMTGIDMDLFKLIRAPNPTKMKTGTRPHAAHEVSLLTVTMIRVIEMKDLATTIDSSGVPSPIERSPLDFANENPLQQSTGGNGTEDQGQGTVDPESAARGAMMGVDTNALPKVLRREHVESRPTESTIGGKSLAAMGIGIGSTFPVPTSQGTPVDVSDSDPLSFANPPSIPTRKCCPGAAIAGDLESNHTSFTSMVGSPESIYQPEWGVTNGCRLDAPEACQDLVEHIAPSGYFSELRHLHNDDFLKQYNINLARQVAMGLQLRLRFEQEAKLLKKSVAQVARRDQWIQARENEIKNLEALLEVETDMKKTAKANNSKLGMELENLRALFSDLQVSIDRLSQQVSTLQAQVTGEEKLKAAFEDFKQYENDRVEKRCAEMDARLDALSIYFDKELYPHMLSAIACRRWVIGHGLRLAIMKCDESTELRQVFADVVSAGITKGMSEGLKYGVGHEKANLDLEAIEAYDPEADAKYVATLHALRDLKYPMVDQLESLKDAPIDVIMASLHLVSDTGDDASQ
nr:hypothetical protein [Tanacetum cinerariifolium]